MYLICLPLPRNVGRPIVRKQARVSLGVVTDFQFVTVLLNRQIKSLLLSCPLALVVWPFQSYKANSVHDAETMEIAPEAVLLVSISFKVVIHLTHLCVINQCRSAQGNG